MAIRHGKNVGVFIGGSDLSGDLNEITPNSVQDLADVTTFNSAGTVGHSFYPGLAKDTGTIKGVYNDTEKALFESIIQQVTGPGALISFGSNLGDPAYGLAQLMLKANSIKSVISDVNRVEVSFDTDNQPFEPSVMLTAGIQSVAAASTGTGTSVNNGSASGTTGGAAYLQIFAVNGGGTLTVSIQTSTTGAFAGEQATTATFAAASTNTTQRLAITTQITQYARAAWVGAVGTSQFALSLTRY